jgi:murein peptide amidase A
MGAELAEARLIVNILAVELADTTFIAKDGRRSIELLLEPLVGARGVTAQCLGAFECHGHEYHLPRLSFRGPNSADPIRLAIFAAIHGDEPAGALAAVQFLLELSADPSVAEDYQIDAYPVCNPSGFEDNTRHSRRGKDLNREFWKNSTEPEVQLLEKELRARHFHGIIQLHADDTSDGIYGFVRGHTLTEALLRPALREAGKILPRNVNATIDGFAARDSIIFKHYEGVLAAPAEMDPVPFEIIFETPHSAPIEKQAQAIIVALRTIMTEYRMLMAFAQNI